MAEIHNFSEWMWIVKDANTILEEFHEIAKGRCAFSLKSGAYYEGYIIEIDNDRLRFGEGGPMAAAEYLLIPVREVDLLSLAYWDEHYGYYMDARWDDEQNKWVFSHLAPIHED
jgi:hypothetical protein